MGECTLVIHIGTKKTGTTTLQGHLKRNKELLADNGIFVSTTSGMTEDKLVSRSYMSQDKAPAHVWFKEAEEAMRQGMHMAILTAESLADLSYDEITALAQDIPAIFSEVSVILYVRRQDRVATSHFSTALRGGSTSKLLFSSAMGKRGRRAFSYGTILCDWLRIFGKDNITLRNYGERELGNFDVIEDFSSFTHSSIKYLPKSIVTLNTSLSLYQMAYLRYFNLWKRKQRMITPIFPKEHLFPALGISDDSTPAPKPSRNRAAKFYASFKEDNELMFKIFPESRSFFIDDFSMYPAEDFDLDSVVDVSRFKKVIEQHTFVN